ncbi:MAG: hypothetical protein KDH96_03655 [Candidatus Riesia sp.]|nr:hypothetical protein [Candidatus Riesia sp.]
MITKLIPFSVRIKSLYWVRKEREINLDLEDLFSKIDNDQYEEASTIEVQQISQRHTLVPWFGEKDV